MITQEYYSVKELSKLHGMTPRHIRRIMTKLIDEGKRNLIFKENGNWKIHHLLESKFNPIRIHKKKWIAINIDPSQELSNEKIKSIMKFVFEQMGEGTIINYTIEGKRSNQRNHIHGYVNCQSKRKLVEAIKLGFGNVSYLITEVYDLQGWISYITKENNEIINLK